MRECLVCGFTCGTDGALERHMARTRHAPPAPSSTDPRCPHVGQPTCGCSKYRILGLSAAHLSVVGLREALRKLSLEWHPDRTATENWRSAHPGIGVHEATEEFKRIRSAYEALMPIAEARERGGARAAASIPLHEAVKSGDIMRVKSLVERFADSAELFALDDGGMDALGWACRRGHGEIVSLLLPLWRAQEAERFDAASAPPVDGGGSLPLSSTAIACESVPTLWAAAAGGNAEVVSLMMTPNMATGGRSNKEGVRGGCDVNAKEPMLGHSSLHAASDRGHVDVVRVLLRSAADVHAMDSRGYSALSVACFKGHAEVVRLLLDAQANMAHEAEGDSPLALASRRGRVDVVRMLLQRGAPKEEWARAQAEAKGHVEVVALLS